jgi:hypothetical protein
LALRYIGALPFGLAIAGVILRQHRRESLPLAGMTTAGAVMALGGTLPLSSNLPILDLINPERALVMVLPGVSLLAGFAVGGVYRAVLGFAQKWQAALAAGGLIALVVADSYFFNERTARTVEFSEEFLAVTDFLAGQPGTPFERVLFIQDDYNLTAYSPALSNKPVTDGSQVQGARTAPDAARLGQPGEGNAGTARAVALASRFNVRWFVIDREQAAATALTGRLAEAGLVAERFARGRYVVLERLWTPSVVRLAGLAVLEIGPGNDAKIVAALSSTHEIALEHGPSDRLDDYSADALRRYGVVILAAPRIDDRAMTDAMLAEYEAGGGRVLRPDSLPLPPATDVITFDERERLIEVTVPPHGDSPVLLSMGYSPAWRVEVDGVEADSSSNRGLIQFAAAEGSREIAVTYASPVSTRIAQVVSILAWCATLVWLSVRGWRRIRSRDTDRGQATVTPETPER